jgi:hypothetical protein
VTLIGTSSNLLIAGITGSAGVHVEMLSFAAVALAVALVGWLVIYVTGPLILHGSATPPEEVAKSWRVEIPISSRALADGRRRSAWRGPRSSSWKPFVARAARLPRRGQRGR